MSTTDDQAGSAHATGDESAADRQLKARHRALWASGDYVAVATELIPELGPELVRACGIAAGDRVLDVAAGAGNAAIPAAQIMTFIPRSRAVEAYSETDSGLRWAERVSISYATPSSSSREVHFSITSRSESLPTRMPTTGLSLAN